MTYPPHYYLAAVVLGSELTPPLTPEGFYPAIFDYVPLETVGQSVGVLQHDTGGKDLVAITFEDSTDPAVVSECWEKLDAAPDGKVKGLEADLSSPRSAWGARVAFEAQAAAGGMIPSRWTSGVTVKDTLRELARELYLFEFLGARIPTINLNAPLQTMPTAALASLFAFLRLTGFPAGELPASSATLETLYRLLLDHPTWSPFDPGLAGGGVHLGHPAAVL